MLGIFLGAAALLGLTAAILRPLDPLPILFAFAAGLLLAMTGWRSTPLRFLGLLLLALALGALRPTLLPLPNTDALVAWTDERVRLTGTVATLPVERGQTVSMHLDVSDLLPLPGAHVSYAEPLAGQARIEVLALATSPLRTVRVGDSVTLEGTPHLPESPAGYPRADLLRRQGIFTTLRFPAVVAIEPAPVVAPSLADRIRSSILDQFNRLLPNPQSALATGLLIGGSSSFRLANSTALSGVPEMCTG